MADEPNTAVGPPLPAGFGLPTGEATVPNVSTPPASKTPPKTGAAQGSGWTQTTTIRGPVAPPATPSSTQSGSMPGPDQIKRLANHLAELAQDANANGYRIEVYKRNPLYHNKKRCKAGKVLSVSPCSFPELEDQIIQLAGGGTYAISLHDESGRYQHGCVLTIDLHQHPPVLAEDEYAGTNGTASAASGAEKDALSDIRIAAERHALELEQRRRERQAREEEEAAEERRLEREARREARSGTAMSEQMAQLEARLKQERDNLEKKLEAERLERKEREERYERERKEQREREERERKERAEREREERAERERRDEAFRTNLLAAVQAIMPIFVARGDKSDSALEAAKIQSETQREIARMQSESQTSMVKEIFAVKREGGKYEDRFFSMMDKLFTTQANEPKRQFREWMDMVRMIRDENPMDPDEPPPELFPGAGQWQPIISGIMSWLSQTKVGQQIMQRMQGPNAPALPVSPSGDPYRDMATALAPHIAQHITQLTGAQAPRALPQQGNPQFNVIGEPDTESDTDDAGAAVTPPPLVTAPPPTAAPAQPQMPALNTEERLRFVLNGVTDRMLAELPQGTTEHQWAQVAVHYLSQDAKGKAFLDKFVEADDTGKIQLMQQYIEPGKYVKLFNLALGGGDPYKALLDGLQLIVNEHKGGNA